MSLDSLDISKLKLILRTSQRMPAQAPWSKARVIRKAGQDPRISPTRAGHPVSLHVQAAAPTQDVVKPYAENKAAAYRTQFCSLDDMADALDRTLKSPSGKAALVKLRSTVRVICDVSLPKVFSVRVVFDKYAPVTLDAHALARIGIHATKCKAILEARPRGADRQLHLHVHTFYPVIMDHQVSSWMTVANARVDAAEQRQEARLHRSRSREQPVRSHR